jgi:hypothetical protein
MEFELDTIVPEAAANPLRRAPPAARHSVDERSTYSWGGASPRDEALSPLSEAPPSVYQRTRTPSKPCLRDSARNSCRGSIRGGSPSAMFASAASPESSVGAAGVESPSDGSRHASFNGVGRERHRLSVGDAHATHRAVQLSQFVAAVGAVRSDVSAGSGFEAVTSQETCGAESRLRGGDTRSQPLRSGGSQQASPSSPGASGGLFSSVPTPQNHGSDPLHDDALSLDSDGDAAGATNPPSGNPMAPSGRVSGGVGGSIGVAPLTAVTPAVDRSVELNRAVHAKFKGKLLSAERASPQQQASPAVVHWTGLVPSTAVTPAVDRSVALNRAVHAKFKGNLMSAKR